MEIDTTYEIPECNYPSFTSRIAVLNKQATKLGCAQITIRTVETILEYQFEVCHEMRAFVAAANRYDWSREMVKTGPCAKDWKLTGNVRRVLKIQVLGEAPKFSGWTLAATIQTSEAGNILRCVPGVVLDDIYRTCAPACDHCKADRNRRDTFVVMHEDGSQKQVGRNCIRDFLGHTDPNRLARIAELIFSVGEIAESEGEYYGGGREIKTYITRKYLAHVAAVTDGKAFITSKQAKEEPYPQATSGTAAWNMNPTAEMRKRGEVVAVEPKHEELADKALAYVLENITEPKNEFEHNLLVVAKSEAIEGRTMGIAAYLILYYRKQTEAAVARAARAPSAHFGEIKKRYKAGKFVYLGTSSFPTQFGVKHINRLKQGDNIAVWKTTTEDFGNLDAGAEVVMDYTVEEHSEYKGTKQTGIKRCKVISSVNPLPQVQQK